MINKIYKRIHNKYLTLFKFIFFLRYLFGVFFISLSLFLLIPNFFDYKKKDEIIKNYFLENYGLKLNKYENIKFNSLPSPNLEILNASINLGSTSIKLSSKKINLYLSLVNIYDYKNFKAKKIVFNKNKISLKINELKMLSDYLYNLQNKLIFNNLAIDFFKGDKSLINFKKINFTNYGHKKNIINGVAFDRKFKIKINDNFQEINFKLLNTGINVDINFKEIKKNTPIDGTVKAKVLNSNLKFDFEYDKEKLKIYNSYFRNKKLSFNNKTTITFHPFFEVTSSYIIEDINTKLFKNLNINKILDSKNLIKKINSKNIINYKSKKFSRSLIDDLNLNIDLAYGRLVYSKNFTISENFFNCAGDINLLEEYPKLFFNCSVISKDKKKLLKKFSIKYKTENELLDLNLKGNINILNNKINFKSIQMGDKYKATEEDLKYFKNTFEAVLLDKDFLNIFRLEKIKEYILEIN